MTIKSDLWLRKMATEHKMIDPFLPDLVRESNGSRIISAGASSYGYDMRLADDGFRIFSSVYGLEIDPKHFDENSLIEPEVRTAEEARNIICCRRIITDSALRSRPSKCRET